MDRELDASISHVTSPNNHKHGESIISTVPKESVVILSKSLPPRKEALESLVRSKPHYLKLHSLQDKEAKMMKEMSKKRRAVHRHKREIYETICLYTVLQGLLFMGVSQSNNAKCSDSWGTIVLAIAIAIAAVLATADKIGMLRRQKEEFQRHKDRLNAIFCLISDLRDRGAEVDLETLRIKEQQEEEEEEEEGYCRIESSFHVYRSLVLSFLVLFSVLVAFCSHRMLCADA